jgi:hypothetical protein
VPSAVRIAPRVALAAVTLALAALVLSWRADDRACEEAGKAVFLSSRDGGAPLRDAIADVREHCRGGDTLVAVSAVLAQAGRADGATAAAREAVRRSPEDFRAWIALSVALADSSPREAAVARQRALELNPLAAPDRRGAG